MILRTWIHDATVSLLFVLSVCMLMESAPRMVQTAKGPRLPIPTWPPDDTKPATAEAHR